LNFESTRVVGDRDVRRRLGDQGLAVHGSD